MTTIQEPPVLRGTPHEVLTIETIPPRSPLSRPDPLTPNVWGVGNFGRIEGKNNAKNRVKIKFFQGGHIWVIYGAKFIKSRVKKNFFVGTLWEQGRQRHLPTLYPASAHKLVNSSLL